MKHAVTLFSLALLGLTSCRPDNTDGANDAAGTASPYLAREVVGVHMLSNDYNYDKVSTFLAEDLVRGTFNVEGAEMDVTDTREGGTFSWGKNKVTVAFQTSRPYQSIYHAEQAFNNLYQDGTRAVPETPEKPPLSGPNPEGTGAELPAESATGSIAQRDMSAKNDTTPSISGIKAASAQLTTPAVSTNRFAAYPGLGDKAVWDASTKSMHVLMNNHVLNVRVNTADNATVAKERAAILANVMLDRLLKSY